MRPRSANARSPSYAKVQVRAGPADERFVNDPLDPGSPRVAHDPVNDSGGNAGRHHGYRSAPRCPPTSNPDPAGFRFNLDDALARLSEPHQPIPRFKWSAVTPSATIADTDRRTPDALRSPTAPSLQDDRCSRADGPARRAGPGVDGSMFPDQESRARPLTQPTLDPLPEIREATQVGPRRHRPLVDGRRSTPPPARSSRPLLSPSPVAAPLARGRAPLPAPSAAAAAPMIVTGSDAFAAGVERIHPRLGLLPDARRAAQPGASATVMPRLPDSDPAAAPPMATMVSSTSAASTARSPSAAKGRKKAKRRGFGKVVLVLVAPGRALRRGAHVRP